MGLIRNGGDWRDDKRGDTTTFPTLSSRVATVGLAILGPCGAAPVLLCIPGDACALTTGETGRATMVLIRHDGDCRGETNGKATTRVGVTALAGGDDGAFSSCFFGSGEGQGDS